MTISLLLTGLSNLVQSFHSAFEFNRNTHK